MEKSQIIAIVLGVIVVILGVAGGIIYYQNTQLNSTVSSLNLEKTQLTSQGEDLKSQVSSLEDQVTLLKDSNENLTEQVSGLSAQLVTLNEELTQLKGKNELSICTGVGNLCLGRTPGSEYRCSADGKYSSSGEHYCKCLTDCGVEIH